MSHTNDPRGPCETPITFPINLPGMTGQEALALVTILDSVCRQIWQTFEVEMTIALLRQEGLDPAAADLGASFLGKGREERRETRPALEGAGRIKPS